MKVSTFNTRKDCTLTIDHYGATLTVDPDPHYGGTTVLQLSNIAGVRHTGLTSVRDLVMISTAPGHRPCSVPFEAEETARSFAYTLTAAVKSARHDIEKEQEKHPT